MDKKAYNLKRTFEQPIVMYEFTDKFRINKGFRLDFWATFLIVWFILFFFLWDFVIFVFNVQLRKVKLSYDEEVEYHDKKITFK